MSTIAEHSQSVGIDTSTTAGFYSMAFAASGEHVVSSHENEVRVWQAKDGKQVARMITGTGPVICLAVSEDQKWIAAGTYWSGATQNLKDGDRKEVFLWDAKTYEQVFSYRANTTILAIDFSPNSTRLAVGSKGSTVTVLDIITRKHLQTLRHQDWVFAAKYSPQGDRIAAIAENCIRVWDGENGRLLVEIKGDVFSYKDLYWSDIHLVVTCGKTIKQFNSITGSAVPDSEWQVPGGNYCLFVSLRNHRAFVAYPTDDGVTLWDASTRAQLGVVQHLQGKYRKIALSPDDRFLAGGSQGKITICSIPDWSRLHTTFPELEIKINDTALDSWKNDQLANADALLTIAITTARNPVHVLASRALVRARLQLWDAAIEDAEKAIDTQPSIIAFIAKSIAHVGKGEKDKGYQTCDIAFERFRPYLTFLLLVKAIVVFMAGDHPNAISRVDDLIATTFPFNSICYTVQAYMHFLLGNSQMTRSDYDAAIHSFERARDQMRGYIGPPAFSISLITGWKFDNLSIMIRQQLCETLYAAGRIVDAVECFHGMESKRGLTTGEHYEWGREFRKRSFEKLQSLGDVAIGAKQYEDAISHYTIALFLNPSFPRAILIAKRSKARLAIGLWRHALDDANWLIGIDPSSPLGYELKHAALHMGGDYASAAEALETMRSKMAESH